MDPFVSQRVVRQLVYLCASPESWFSKVDTGLVGFSGGGRILGGN